MACSNFEANIFKDNLCSYCMRSKAEHDARLTTVTEEASGKCLPCTPPGTPRKTAGANLAAPVVSSPRAGGALVTPQRKSMGKHRDSKVSFLETFDVIADACGEDSPGAREVMGLFDMFGSPGAEDGAVEGKNEGEVPHGASVQAYAMADSDEDEDDDELDDEYDFDPEKLADLVKAKASQAELVEAAERALAASLERKLTDKLASKFAKEVPLGKDNPYADDAERVGMAEDISGRMTPGNMTPTEGSAVASPAQPSDEFDQRMREAIETAKARRNRRSSTRGVNSQINEAMKEAAERRRRSMAKAAAGAEAEQIKQAMHGAQLRHRKSISKAADVLECAGYDEAEHSIGETQVQLDRVASAMEEARRRHRRSIARAVNQLEEPPHLVPPEAASHAGAHGYSAEDGWTSSSTWGNGYSTCDMQISQAVNSAYKQHQEYYECYGFESAQNSSWASPAAAAWGGSPADTTHSVQNTSWASPAAATWGASPANSAWNGDGSWQQPQQTHYQQQPQQYDQGAQWSPNAWQEPQSAYDQQAGYAGAGSYSHNYGSGYAANGFDASGGWQQSAGGCWSGNGQHSSNVASNPWRLGAA